jgi:hypothetical protein
MKRLRQSIFLLAISGNALDIELGEKYLMLFSLAVYIC